MSITITKQTIIDKINELNTKITEYNLPFKIITNKKIKDTVILKIYSLNDIIEKPLFPARAETLYAFYLCLDGLLGYFELYHYLKNFFNNNELKTLKQRDGYYKSYFEFEYKNCKFELFLDNDLQTILYLKSLQNYDENCSLNLLKEYGFDINIKYLPTRERYSPEFKINLDVRQEKFNLNELYFKINKINETVKTLTKID